MHMENTNKLFLTIQNVGKIFGIGKDVKVVGLKQIDLEIDRGEFVVISGPSGSGKTTLLNIVGGLDSASEGRVVLEGIELSGLEERKLAALRRDSIGFIFRPITWSRCLRLGKTLNM